MLKRIILAVGQGIGSMFRFLGWKGSVATIAVVSVFTYGICEYLNIRPNIRTANPITYDETVTTVGYRTVHANAELIDILLNKPGGFMTNDILPPFILIDDIKRWEYGVVQVLRKSLVVMRDSMTRVQTQSQDNPDVVAAFNHMNISTEQWSPFQNNWVPSAESEYTAAMERLRKFEANLISPEDDGNLDNFYTRATSLVELLATMNRVLGNHAQALDNAVGAEERVNAELAGEKNAEAANYEPTIVDATTHWTKIDDVFWEANGSAWSILEILKAVRYDYEKILADKNANLSLDQIIEQLESSQQPLQWPWVANGTGFRGFANHSLILKSYISNASQSMSDLIRLLKEG